MKPPRHSHTVFESEFGAVGVAWSSRGLVGVQLPEGSAAKTRQRLAERASSTPGKAPRWVEEAVQGMRAMLAGAPAQLEKVPLDDAHVPEFHGRVYAALRKIPQGETCTYGELAKAAGSPSAARAVGQAMRKNPWPLVVPCHRVLAAGGRLGGFSAAGGLDLKLALLRAESARATPAMARPTRDRSTASKPAKARPSRAPRETAAPAGLCPFDPAVALGLLRESDPRLAALIDRVPYTLAPSKMGSTFEALLRTIVYQQLNGKAAATIHARVVDLLADKRIDPRALLAVDPARLRAAGMSHAKIAAARDLAQRSLAGELPDREELGRMDDEQIVERLTVVRGIGRWSVEMLLMFWLMRPDVLPVGDFGVRQGFMHLMRRREMPTEEELERHARRWRPYRSVASWYMWRAVDEQRALEQEQRAQPPPSRGRGRKSRAR